ncbi:uncharacterized protein LOC126989887 [Eriocheir sinensis]|uniref:uncharacterized protein LOC126989887 n=1 Tax=Eriocheir sinensis TaxID=95602 RepID=UPI0021CAE077|nr:uncharacterized protein LOC126989887 [Eriocheir sinensis]
MESRSERYTPPASPAAPCLRVLQWNVQGLQPKRHEVLQAIFQEGLDVVLLQETLTPADFTRRVAGYTLHSLPATGEGGRGCVTLVRSAIPHRRITAPVHCGDGVETLAVELQLGALSLTVYNIYRSQRHQLEAGELLGLAAHSIRLPTNAAGRHLAVLLEDSPHVRLLNTGEATHVLGGRLDLTFVSRDLTPGARWQVYPTLTSDHYGITITTPAPPPPPPRWNIRVPDWVRFRATLEEWWADYQPPLDLHQQERDLTAAMERTADASIPRSAATRRQRPSWWFYNEEVSLRAKEKKWLEWCASFNQHTPLGQLWRNLRTTSGYPAPRPAAHPHPRQEAERLVDTFTTRASSDQLPARTRCLQEQLRPQRERAVTEASKEPDVTDIPFTQQELARAKRGRDTAAGADGVTYSMLAHAGPAGDAALLALLNASWRAGRLPPAWKQADIQPIPKPREPTKLRPISLPSCTGKTAERMVLSRLQWRAGDIHHNVFGFARGLSTAGSITTLLARTNNRPTIAVFLDLRIPREEGDSRKTARLAPGLPPTPPGQS